MKKLFLFMLTTVLISCGGKNKEVDPKLYQEGVEMAREKINKHYEENAQNFINATNKAENVSTFIKDSILIVKIISKDGVDYDSFVEFYHDLAHKHSVRITGTQLQDSITGEILTRCGYGFDCLGE